LCSSREVLVPFSVTQSYRDCLGRAAPKAVPLRRSLPQRQPTFIGSVWQVVLAVLSIRLPDDPVYTTQSGVVTSRRRSWDLILRSFIPVSRVVTVSSNPYPHAVNDLSPSINFRRGTDRHIFLMPPSVAQRSITSKLIRLLGFFPCQQSVPQWSPIHHRSILPWI